MSHNESAHERWCQTLNPLVGYAYKIVVSANEFQCFLKETVSV